MRIANAVEQLRTELASLAALGDETTHEIADRLGEAMVRPLTAVFLELLGEVASELEPLAPSGRIEVRLAGDEAKLVYVEDASGSEEPDGDSTARITLRLSDQLKARVEEAASREGISVNTYIVHALSYRARPSGPQGGRRLTGYGRG